MHQARQRRQFAGCVCFFLLIDFLGNMIHLDIFRVIVTKVRWSKIQWISYYLNKIENINCSQTKVVAIILALAVVFNAIFRLTDFPSDPFDFSCSTTGYRGSGH